MLSEENKEYCYGVVDVLVNEDFLSDKSLEVQSVNVEFFEAEGYILTKYVENREPNKLVRFSTFKDLNNLKEGLYKLVSADRDIVINNIYKRRNGDISFTYEISRFRDNF